MKNRLTAFTLTVFVLAFGGNNAIAQNANGQEHQSRKSMTAPKVIIFDVNETLLDLAPLRESVGKVLGSRWFRIWSAMLTAVIVISFVFDSVHAATYTKHFSSHGG